MITHPGKTKTLEVHHIVPRVHAEASGTTYVVPRLCEELQQLGLDTHLHVVRKKEGAEYPFTLHEYPFWRVPERLGVSPAMHRSLRDLAHRPVILHNHSLWMMPNVYPGLVRAGGACRLMVSPHGTVSQWALGHSRLKKKFIWWMGQRHLMQRADCFHATAGSEYEEIRKLGFRQPVAIIPNGMDLSYGRRPLSPHTGPDKQLLFLARIHPKKGLELLFEVWRKLQDDFPHWKLVVAGPEDYPGYMEKLRGLATELSLKRLSFAGPVFGQAKEDLFFNADLYVLPTQNENFGITVAEALLAGVPAVVSHGAPWQGLEEHACGWWVPRRAETLGEALRQGMSIPPEEKLAMGRRGRAWIEENFGWPETARKMRKTYAWIMGQAEKPEWVYTT